MARTRRRLALAFLIALTASSAGCDDAPDPLQLNGYEKERLTIVGETVSAVRIDQAIGPAGSGSKRTRLKRAFPIQGAKATCDDHAVEATYNPYSRVLELRFSRDGDAVLAERWYALRVNGKPFDSKPKARSGDWLVDTGKRSEHVFTWKPTKDQRAELLPEGEAVKLELVFDTLVTTEFGKDKFREVPNKYSGITIELYSFSADQSKALAKYRDEASMIEGRAAEYDARERSLKELESIEHADARALEEDFRRRKADAHEALKKLAPSPYEEHRTALKLTLACP